MSQGHRYAAVAAISLLVVLLAGVLVYVARDDAQAHRNAASQARRADGLDRQLAAAQAENGQLSSRLATLQTDNSHLQDLARNPTLAMWNSCGGPCQIGPNAVRVGSVPDTFQLQVNFTSDVPIRAYVFTFHQWTQFDSCGFNARCVSGSYRTFDAATSMNQTVDEAEGCSGYVWVLQSDQSGTITPDVKVHYLPADHPTGVCAQSP